MNGCRTIDLMEILPPSENDLSQKSPSAKTMQNEAHDYTQESFFHILRLWIYQHSLIEYMVGLWFCYPSKYLMSLFLKVVYEDPKLVFPTLFQEKVVHQQNVVSFLLCFYQAMIVYLENRV